MIGIISRYFPCVPCRATPLVLAVVLIDTASFGIAAPVLPELVSQLGRMSVEEAPRTAGWLLVVYAVAQLVAGPILGNLSDAYGRRSILLFASIGLAIDYVIMANAPSLAWLVAGRAIAGVGGATIGPAGAVLADITPPEKRSAAFGLIGAAFAVGFIVGPGLGAVSASWGVRAPFVVAAGAAAVNALLIFVAMPETLETANRRPFRLRDATVVGSFRPLFGLGHAWPLLAAWFLWQLGIVVYPSTWAFWATIRFGWDAGAIGWSIAYSGLLTILVQSFVTRPALRRLGERDAAVLGLAFTAISLFAYSVAVSVWQVYAFFVVGAFGAFVYPSLGGLLSKLVDATRQGAMQGGLSALNSVAAIIGPLLASQSLAAGVAHDFPGAAFLVASTLSIVALAIVFVFVPREAPADATGPETKPAL